MKNILKIMLGVLLAVTVCVVAYPIILTATQAPTEAIEAAIGYNLYWGYVLVALVLVSALFGSAYGMMKSSTGLLKTLLSFAAVVIIIVGSYLYASSHTIEIFNIEDGSVFGAVDTIITETSVVIAYIAMAGAILAAIGSEVMGVFK